MPLPLTSYIDDCLDCFIDAKVALGNAKNYIYGAGTKLKTGDLTAAGNNLQLAGDELDTVMKNMHGRRGVWQYYLIDALEWIDDNWVGDIEPYKLTWQAICEAWIKDDFAGKEWTIACIDRMRTLMWDKPFDIKWAASPTEQKE
ncbi:hypothetical protein ES703_43605 [subsurface metagenome]